MAKWKVTTAEGVDDVNVGDYYFDGGPGVDSNTGALSFYEYVQSKGSQLIAVYNKEYWLKAERDDEEE